MKSRDLRRWTRLALAVSAAIAVLLLTTGLVGGTSSLRSSQIFSRAKQFSLFSAQRIFKSRASCGRPRQLYIHAGKRGTGSGDGPPMPFMEGPPEGKGELLPPQMIPLKPKSTLGMALRRTIYEDTESFDWTQDEQIKWLCSQKDKIKDLKIALRRTNDDEEERTKLVSKRKIQEEQKSRSTELAKMVTDLLYNMVLMQFERIGVDPVGAGELEGPFTDLGPVDLVQLTTGIHTQEALEMVRSHLMSILGPMMPKDNQGFYTSAAKMPKLQLSQMYMTSVMFGYFLRRVDRRYQVAKKLEMLDKTSKTDEAVRRLEDMLRISREERENDPNYDSAFDDSYEDYYDFESSHGVDDSEENEEKGDGSISLKEYIERFDQRTLIQSASLMSQEAAILLQEYQYALFGNIRELQREMAVAIGQIEEPSPESVMKKISEAVQEDRVQTLVITFADQRRLVLEAVALGGFLRESEDYVTKRASTEILTPLPPLPMDDSPIRGILNPGTG